MKAVRFHEYGDPDVLRVDEIEPPVPGPGQVLVRVAGTTFNGVDGNIRAGLMQGPMPLVLPHVPGVDVSGTVSAVGAGVTGRAVGDRVIGFLPFVTDGATAEQVAVDDQILATAPTTIPLVDAAALPVVGLTAWQALFVHADLRSGQRILVNGAGGAVGGHAVQLAATAGAHVVATASGRSRARVAAAGAHEVIDHTTTDVADALDEPVDVLLQLAPISPEEFATLSTKVRDGGVVVSTTVWMPAPGDEARGVRAVDLYVDSDASQLAGLVTRIDRGELHVDIAERVPFTDLASVHERAAAGTLTGKVVVVVDDSSSGA